MFSIMPKLLAFELAFRLSYSLLTLTSLSKQAGNGLRPTPDQACYGQHAAVSRPTIPIFCL